MSQYLPKAIVRPVLTSEYFAESHQASLPPSRLSEDSQVPKQRWWTLPQMAQHGTHVHTDSPQFQVSLGWCSVGRVGTVYAVGLYGSWETLNLGDHWETHLCSEYIVWPNTVTLCTHNYDWQPGSEGTKLEISKGCWAHELSELLCKGMVILKYIWCILFCCIHHACWYSNVTYVTGGSLWFGSCGLLV